MASTYLTRTFGQAGNRRTFTISYWVKMGYVSTTADGWIMGSGADGSNSDDLYIHTGRLNFSGYYGSTVYGVRTSAKYRDLSGWYHHVIRFDSTQSTASDRARLYVNGELQTALDSDTYPSQNLETTYINTARQHTIGASVYGSSIGNFFNGSISHFHFCDGYSYGADSFGSTDSTTGEWKINTSPSVTYGTNGFFILKDGNSVTDQSPNTNNFTVGGGTLTKTEDNPSNVFATMNALDNYFASATFTNGNNTVNFNNTNERYLLGTMGFNSGKWYWEVKYDAKSGDTHSKIGIESIMKAYPNGYEADSYGYRSSNGKKVNGGTFTTYGDSYTVGDIVGVAVDLDNNKIYFSKNGTWQDSGNPASGASGTGAAFTVGTPSSGFYFPAVGKEDADTCQFSFNFGNGYFGTTAVSSAGTNASGIGIFEYDVPTGYTALSTKGLNL
jgi:hypothetical protein